MKILDELRRLRREATPEPWGVLPALDSYAVLRAVPGDDRLICDELTEENAAYITAACNASEALERVARAAEVYVDRSNDANAFRLLAELEALAKIEDDDEN